MGAISGAVGTYAATSPGLRARACSTGSGCAPRTVSTQVVARDRHAELLQAIALAGAGLERFATEIRHLQRTEVREVEEPFRAGQKGSSAMPHKRNPIISERHHRHRAPAARLRAGRRSRTSPSGTSATSRTRRSSGSTLPDATILLDYAQSLALRVVDGMTVHADRMRANLDATHGALYSQRALLALVEAGRTRDEAYRIVQEDAQRAWDTGTPLPRAARRRPRRSLDLDAIFDPRAFVRHAGEIVGRLDAIAPQPSPV